MYFERQSDREMQRQREIFSLVHSLTGHNSQVCVSLKPGARISTLVSHTGSRGSRAWTVFCFLPRHVNRKLHQKQCSQDSAWRCDIGCQRAAVPQGWAPNVQSLSQNGHHPVAWLISRDPENSIALPLSRTLGCIRVLRKDVGSLPQCSDSTLTATDPFEDIELLKKTEFWV